MCADFSAHLVVWEALENGPTTPIPYVGDVHSVFITAPFLPHHPAHSPSAPALVPLRETQAPVSVLFVSGQLG